MMAVRRQPRPLPTLCELTGIAESNIWKYLRRLERGHYVLTKKEYVEDDFVWVVYEKTGYLHDPHTKLLIGGPDNA